MANILIVEDEKKLNDMLKDMVVLDKHKVTQALNGKEALKQFEKNDYDLIITDIMMPKMNGYELTERIREVNQNIPILMLTAKVDSEDEIKGFELGVTDYVKKPFSMYVLRKRINFQLNRIEKQKSLILKDKLNNLDPDKHILNNKIELTQKEFKILSFFMSNPNKILTREEIIDYVWGINYYADPRIVDNHIKNLRKKLKKDNIVSKSGLGYMYEI
ncbi:MAG: response regulator transcription factor [Mycoplasmatales bacterium]